MSKNMLFPPTKEPLNGVVVLLKVILLEIVVSLTVIEIFVELLKPDTFMVVTVIL